MRKPVPPKNIVTVCCPHWAVELLAWSLGVLAAITILFCGLV